MKVAVIGATGFVGSAITKELADRKHTVTAITRNPGKHAESSITELKADANNVNELATALENHDVVVSAYNAGWENPNIYDDFLAGSKAIQEAVRKAGVKRFIVIGGGGSLFVAPGVQAVDTPEFPAEIRQAASAARDYLTIIKEEKDIDWAFFSPAFEMHAGITTGRTGNYRLGTENPVFDEHQRSVLSVEDLAVVIADEVEQPKHHQVRFTAGY